MTVFVYEHLTALAGSADLRSALPASLLAEGRAMFDAVAADFLAAGIAVVSLDRENEETFRQLAAEADFSLVIAPEFDRILEQRCRWVEDSGGRLLGPSSDSVRQTADKLALCRHFQKRKIPTPATHEWNLETQVASERQRGKDILLTGARSLFGSERWIVLKPRFGAGSQTTFLLKDESDLQRALADLGDDPTPMILQPYVPGIAASVSFLIGPIQTVVLEPCSQILSDDGRFSYLGGSAPLAPGLIKRAEELGISAIESVPGLFGYVGVDLVLGDEDVVIEINPRLTTSYVGLRRLARFNLAETMLRVALGAPVGPLEWRTEPVKFAPSGTV